MLQSTQIIADADLARSGRPLLVKVYGHIGDTFALGPGWLLAIAAMIVAHFLSVWAL